MKRVRVTLVPIVIAIAAFFIVLPRTGGDLKIRMIGSEGSYRYEPGKVEAAVDARILVVNDTEATHTITSATGEFDLVIQPGDSRFLELADSAAYDFFCRFHGSSDGMTGTLRLGNPVSTPLATPSPAATT